MGCSCRLAIQGNINLFSANPVRLLKTGPGQGTGERMLRRNVYHVRGFADRVNRRDIRVRSGIKISPRVSLVAIEVAQMCIRSQMEFDAPWDVRW